MTRRQKLKLVSIASPIVALALWELLSRVGLADPRFFPPPSGIVHQLFGMVLDGSLWPDVSVTIMRILVGFVAGTIPAIILGMAIGLSPWVRAASQPLVSMVYPIPKTAVLPLILLVFGLGETSKVVFIAIGVFFLVLLNTSAGVIGVGNVYYDVGKAFNASPMQLVRTIALPGALPLIVTGMELGLGTALILVVIVELTASSDGIGYMLWHAWQVFDVETMYVGLITIGILGFLSAELLRAAERRIIPWRRDHN